MMQHCNRNFLKREYFGPCHLISLALMKASYWHALKLTVANDSLRPVLDLRRHRVSDSNQPLGAHRVPRLNVGSRPKETFAVSSPMTGYPAQDPDSYKD